MRPAALRSGLLIAAGLAVCGCTAAEPPKRAKPSRPSTAAAPPAPRARAAQTNTVSLTEVATRLGLKVKSGRDDKEVLLTDGQRRLELEAESRECMVNGVRVYLGDPVSSRRGKLQVSATDFETCLVPLLRPALISRRAPRPQLVAIDAGHGGNDQGTENARLGLKEKVFTLDVARRLKQLLEARGYRTVLTRDADERVENPQRALIARRAGADLFVSIHFNSLFPDTKTTGAEVFTFTRAGQRSDSSRGFGQPDDTEDEAAPVNRHDPWSSVLAHALHRRTLAALKLPDRGQKTKHLGMLRGLDCPAALVESGFLSNEEEARKISTPVYRQKIAEALADAIDDYSRLAGGRP